MFLQVGGGFGILVGVVIEELRNFMKGDRRMYKTRLLMSLIVLAGIAGSCQAQQGANKRIEIRTGGKAGVEITAGCEELSLDGVLKKLHEQSEKLKTYQARISYLVIQLPGVIDSHSLRKGRIYYLKDKKGSNLRIDLLTLKQDEDDPIREKKQFFFDGVWFTEIDHPFKRVESWQQARPNKPKDVFEFISQYFPIVGFSKIQDLPKNFDISMVKPLPGDSKKLIHLRLIVKKDSIYKDSYKAVDFWIDKKTFLPVRTLAKSTEEDIYDIRFADIKVNKKLKKSVFKVETPQHFSKNVNPLKQK